MNTLFFWPFFACSFRNAYWNKTKPGNETAVEMDRFYSVVPVVGPKNQTEKQKFGQSVLYKPIYAFLKSYYFMDLSYLHHPDFT